MTTDRLPPLVVVEVLDDHWVVTGNRRLKALKGYQANVSDRVCMRCIVHDLNGTQPVHSAIVAKFLDAATTEKRWPLCGVSRAAATVDVILVHGWRLE